MNIYSSITLNNGTVLELNVQGRLAFRPFGDEARIDDGSITLMPGHHIPELIAALQTLHELSLKQSTKKQHNDLYDFPIDHHGPIHR